VNGKDRADKSAIAASPDQQAGSHNTIVFLTPEDARYGFSLAGVRQEISDAAAASGSLQRLTEDRNVGLVFIDERLHWGIDEEWLEELEKNWPGLVIVLPAPEKLEEIPEDYAMQLIVKAIGYQVRL